MAATERSRIDKLGVKAESRVVVLGIKDASFWRELRRRAGDVLEGRLKKNCDFIFLLAEQKAALRRLRALEPRLKRNGAVWVLWPKGQPHIKQTNVMAAAKQAGLVDVKIVAFSETYSALKLVIPLACR
ncbi:MAG: DUF3052 family protein [Candidatus Acidiferrales bacterium]